MDWNLRNKNALVCGSSRGIGKATAIELAKLGANVTLVSRSGDQLSEVIGELALSGDQDHDFLVADFSQPEALKQRLSTFLKQKEIHILVNNTGGPPGGLITEAEGEAFSSAFKQHVLTAQLLAQGVLPHMKKSGYGRIINIISTSVKEPIPGLGVSNTIRAAMANWAKTWAQEVGSYGITVNNILPGYTKTSRLEGIIEKKAESNNSSRDEVVIQMKRNVPLRRFAEASEIGSAAAFLASPAASYISGINLPVDGGRTKSL